MEFPSPAVPHPSMTFPSGARLRGNFPSTRGPDISGSIPTLIARNPDVARPRRHTTMFINIVWRTNLYDDTLGSCGDSANCYKKRQEKAYPFGSHKYLPYLLGRGGKPSGGRKGEFWNRKIR